MVSKKENYKKLGDRLQTLLLMLSEFKIINIHSETIKKTDF